MSDYIVGPRCDPDFNRALAYWLDHPRQYGEMLKDQGFAAALEDLMCESRLQPSGTDSAGWPLRDGP